MPSVDGRLRVLHACSGLGLGGTEKAMQLFVRHLDRSRFRAAVFAYADGPRREQLLREGIEVFVGPELLRFGQKFAPDVVHIHRAGWAEPRLLGEVKRLRPKAVVETNVFGRYDPTPLARAIDRHLFVSEFCRRRYGAVHGLDVDAPRFGVLPNPVETEIFADPPGGKPWPGPVLGRVSRADPGKWSMLALAIIPHLAREFPDFSYEVIGGTPEARAWVAERGLDAHLRWRDPVATDAGLAAFHHGCAVHAHANDTGETFGMAIAEAMAAGLPVVTHRCPGLKDNAQLELVRDGVTGYVADTPEEYAQAVAHLFRNPELAREMGARGRELVRAHCDAALLGERLGSIYDELLYQKGAPGYAKRHAPLPAAPGLHPGSAALPARGA